VEELLVKKVNSTAKISKCPFCNANINDGWAYCKNCGAKQQ